MGRNGSSTRDLNRHRGGRGGRGGRVRRPRPLKTEKIKGETSGIIGVVFQCHSKQQKRGQFDETMGGAKDARFHKIRLTYRLLNPYFTDLTQPTLTKPSFSNTKSQVTL